MSARLWTWHGARPGGALGCGPPLGPGSWPAAPRGWVSPAGAGARSTPPFCLRRTNPFHWKVWLCLLGVILFSALLHYLLEMTDQDAPGEEKDFRVFHERKSGVQAHALSLGQSLYLAAMAITTVDDHQPTAVPSKRAGLPARAGLAARRRAFRPPTLGAAHAGYSPLLRRSACGS